MSICVNVDPHHDSMCRNSLAIILMHVWPWNQSPYCSIGCGSPCWQPLFLGIGFLVLRRKQILWCGLLSSLALAGTEASRSGWSHQVLNEGPVCRDFPQLQLVCIFGAWLLSRTLCTTRRYWVQARYGFRSSLGWALMHLTEWDRAEDAYASAQRYETEGLEDSDLRINQAVCLMRVGRLVQVIWEGRISASTLARVCVCCGKCWGFQRMYA